MTWREQYGHGESVNAPTTPSTTANDACAAAPGMCAAPRANTASQKVLWHAVTTLSHAAMTSCTCGCPIFGVRMNFARKSFAKLNFVRLSVVRLSFVSLSFVRLSY